MNLVDLPPPTLVEDAEGMGRLLEDLAGQPVIAVDTEADSFFNYREKVCLIQVTVEDRDYLVDPLARFDLSGFGNVLADPARTKVFHDGEYDVLIMKRDYGFDFAGLFDTRVAAAALGVQSPGLASVLREHFGIELDKSMQRSNWSARPLTEKQIRYARLDTRFLIPLMEEQRPQLQSQGRMPIVEGECRRLEALEPTEVEFQPDEFVRIKNVRKLDPMGRSALRELFVARDRLARDNDVPPFKILGNEALFELAKARPRDNRDLGNVRGFSPRQLKRFGPAVLDAIAEAEERGPIDRLPAPPRRDGTGAFTDEEFEVHEALKRWRKRRADREGYDASLVMNRHVMIRLARQQPASPAELAAVEGLLDWQVDQFGDELIETIAKAKDVFRREGPARLRRRSRRS